MVWFRTRWLVVAFAAAFAANSCRRTVPATPARRADLLGASAPGTRGSAEVALGSEEDSPPGIALHIDRVFRDERPLDEPPWHSAGGDWTFFDGHVEKDVGARLLIGVRSRRPGANPIAWGEALLSTPDPASGARVLGAFAHALRQKIPPAREPRPLVALRFRTAVLGADLARDREGGFGDAGGKWTATKWFLQPDGYEAEIYFNYALDEGVAEFSEKDEEYRADLVTILSRVLRDGPRPERTTENDPNLQIKGPRFSDWQLLSAKGSAGRFSADAAHVVFSEKTAGGGERLVRRSLNISEPGLEIFRTDGRIADSEALDAAAANFVILESHPKQPGSWSSVDPTELSLARDGATRRLTGPWGRRPSLPEGSLSPDRRFLAVTEWRDRSDGGRGRYELVHVLDLSTNRARTLAEKNKSWHPVRWVSREGRPLLLVANGFSFDKAPLTHRHMDPLTGDTSPAPAPADSKNPPRVAPDGALSFRLTDGPRLAFETGGGLVRTFVFHEDDARFAEEGCCDWVSDRYVYFRGPRPAFIESATGKMNFPAPAKPPLGSLSFSGDFRQVLSHREDGLWLGRVSVP